MTSNVKDAAPPPLMLSPALNSYPRTAPRPAAVSLSGSLDGSSEPVYAGSCSASGGVTAVGPAKNDLHQRTKHRDAVSSEVEDAESARARSLTTAPQDERASPSVPQPSSSPCPRVTAHSEEEEGTSPTDTATSAMKKRRRKKAKKKKKATTAVENADTGVEEGVAGEGASGPAVAVEASMLTAASSSAIVDEAPTPTHPMSDAAEQQQQLPQQRASPSPARIHAEALPHTSYDYSQGGYTGHHAPSLNPNPATTGNPADRSTAGVSDEGAAGAYGSYPDRGNGPHPQMPNSPYAPPRQQQHALGMPYGGRGGGSDVPSSYENTMGYNGAALRGVGQQRRGMAGAAASGGTPQHMAQRSYTHSRTTSAPSFYAHAINSTPAENYTTNMVPVMDGMANQTATGNTNSTAPGSNGAHNGMVQTSYYQPTQHPFMHGAPGGAGGSYGYDLEMHARSYVGAANGIPQPASMQQQHQRHRQGGRATNSVSSTSSGPRFYSPSTPVSLQTPSVSRQATWQGGGPRIHTKIGPHSSCYAGVAQGTDGSPSAGDGGDTGHAKGAASAPAAPMALQIRNGTATAASPRAVSADGPTLVSWSPAHHHHHHQPSSSSAHDALLFTPEVTPQLCALIEREVLTYLTPSLPCLQRRRAQLQTVAEYITAALHHAGRQTGHAYGDVSFYIFGSVNMRTVLPDGDNDVTVEVDGLLSDEASRSPPPSPTPEEAATARRAVAVRPPLPPATTDSSAGDAEGTLQLTTTADGRPRLAAPAVLSIASGEVLSHVRDYLRTSKTPIFVDALVMAEVKVLKLVMEGCNYDITIGQFGGVNCVRFLHEMDAVIGGQHLLKRTLLLLKAWSSYEAHVLGGQAGYIGSYAATIMLISMINTVEFLEDVADAVPPAAESTSTGSFRSDAALEETSVGVSAFPIPPLETPTEIAGKCRDGGGGGGDQSSSTGSSVPPVEETAGLSTLDGLPPISPLTLLARFLKFYAHFDFDRYCVTAFGPLPLHKITSTPLDLSYLEVDAAHHRPLSGAAAADRAATGLNSLGLTAEGEAMMGHQLRRQQRPLVTVSGVKHLLDEVNRSRRAERQARHDTRTNVTSATSATTTATAEVVLNRAGSAEEDVGLLCPSCNTAVFPVRDMNVLDPLRWSSNMVRGVCRNHLQRIRRAFLEGTRRLESAAQELSRGGEVVAASTSSCAVALLPRPNGGFSAGSQRSALSRVSSCQSWTDAHHAHQHITGPMSLLNGSEFGMANEDLHNGGGVNGGDRIASSAAKRMPGYPAPHSTCTQAEVQALQCLFPRTIAAIRRNAPLNCPWLRVSAPEMEAEGVPRCASCSQASLLCTPATHRMCEPQLIFHAPTGAAGNTSKMSPMPPRGGMDSAPTTSPLRTGRRTHTAEQTASEWEAVMLAMDVSESARYGGPLGEAMVPVVHVPVNVNVAPPHLVQQQQQLQETGMYGLPMEAAMTGMVPPRGLYSPGPAPAGIVSPYGPVNAAGLPMPNAPTEGYYGMMGMMGGAVMMPPAPHSQSVQQPVHQRSISGTYMTNHAAPMMPTHAGSAPPPPHGHHNSGSGRQLTASPGSQQIGTLHVGQQQQQQHQQPYVRIGQRPTSPSSHGYRSGANIVPDGRSYHHVQSSQQMMASPMPMPMGGQRGNSAPYGVWQPQHPDERSQHLYANNGGNCGGYQPPQPVPMQQQQQQQRGPYGDGGGPNMTARGMRGGYGMVVRPSAPPASTSNGDPAAVPQHS